MPHIHSEEGNYDQTASAFIIRTDGNKPKLLLHRHKKSNKYLHFGGHVEINENPWQTIAHELAEEIGYTLDQLSILQPDINLPRFEGKYTVIHPLPVAVVSHPYDLTLKHLHTDTSWVFVTDQKPKLIPAEGESLDVVALTKEQLEAIPKEEIFENIRILSTYALTTALNEWKQVPASEFRL